MSEPKFWEKLVWLARHWERRLRYRLALSLGFAIGAAWESWFPQHTHIVRALNAGLNLVWLWMY